MTALTITGLIIALLVLPGWAAFVITRRGNGPVRWIGLIVLMGLPVAIYLWQYQEALAQIPPRDGWGIMDIVFRAAVGTWWVSALIGFAAGAVIVHRRRRQRAQNPTAVF